MIFVFMLFSFVVDLILYGITAALAAAFPESERVPEPRKPRARWRS